jgi:hypothetical protein
MLYCFILPTRIVFCNPYEYRCGVFILGCCILLRIYPTWFPMTPSIATKFQYVNSLPFFFFLLTTCIGPYRPSSGENIQLMFTRTIPVTTDPLYVHNLTYVVLLLLILTAVCRNILCYSLCLLAILFLYLRAPLT